MSVDAFLKLYDTHYFIDISFCYRLNINNDRFTHRSDYPRTTNLLLYLKDCNGIFRMNNGEVFCASSGDIVYVPKGARYSSELYDKQSESVYAIGINFCLYDSEYREFTSGSSPIVFKLTNPEYYRDIFSKMHKISDTSVPSTSRLNCYFYDIVSSLCEAYQSNSKANKEYRIIQQGIKYLETDRMLDKSISDIASLCMVSENYFRRLFKEYSGVSPKEYILNAKITKAKLILRENNIPISEIAEICGFPDTAYFCRIFKKRTGFSPLAYRNSKNKP